MIRLAVAGALGRMGKTILRLALRDKAFEIAAGFEQSGNPSLGTDLGDLIGEESLGVKLTQDPLEGLKAADVLIDFSHASAAPQNLQAAAKTRTGYVLGTTGLNKPVFSLLKKAAKKIPIVQSPNMSIGVNLLFKLAELTASALDESYDIEIAEIHHRMKKDAPSGTAVKLVEVITGARRKASGKGVIYGRKGEVGARPRGEIGVFAMRGGDVVGDHTVSFLGDGERLEFIHRASSREAFAFGALRAAKFVAKRRRGLYDMRQVLGIA